MFHGIVNANSIIQNGIKFNIGIFTNVNMKAKSISRAKRVTVGGYIFGYKKYSKSIVDDSVIVRNKIINLTNSVSKHLTNTEPTKVS